MNDHESVLAGRGGTCLRLNHSVSRSIVSLLIRYQCRARSRAGPFGLGPHEKCSHYGFIFFTRLKVPAPCDRGHSCCSSQRRLPFQRLSQDFPRCACLSRMNTVPILPLPRSPKETPVTLLQRPFASKIARDPMSCGDGILLCLLSPSPPCASAVSHGVFSSVTRPRKFPRSRLLILGRLSFLSPMCVPLAHRNDGSHNGTDGTAPRSRSVSCR